MAPPAGARVAGEWTGGMGRNLEQGTETRAGPTRPARRAPGAGAVLEATVLGPPRFAVGGLPIALRSRKAEGLLARLCLSPDGRLSREAAANLFWEDRSDHHARSSLRQTLLILRRTLEAVGCDVLSGDKQSIAVDLSSVRLDIDDLLACGNRLPLRLLHERRLADRLLEGGEMLSEAYTVWLRERRRQFHDELRASLEPLLDERGHPPATVEDAALALLNLDPTHEPACRAYIRARAAKGDYAAALRAYEELWNILGDEFDTQPSSETQDLIVEIKLGRFPELAGEARLPSGWQDRSFGFREPDPPPPEDRRPPAGSTAGAETRPRAVLVVSGLADPLALPQSGRVVEIFRQDLIARLARFREWAVLDEVIDHLAWVGAPVYTLLVLARQEGEVIHYTVTVKNLRTGSYVWGRAAEVAADDAMRAQAALLSEIAMAIEVHVDADRIAQMMRGERQPLHALDRLAQARQLIVSRRMEDSFRAEEILADLIREHPRFATPYAVLARLVTSRPMLFPGARQSARMLERATSLAATALGLDPLDSRAHACFGWCAARQNRFDLATASFRQALDLNPCDPWTVLCSAYGLASMQGSLETAQLARSIWSNGLVAGSDAWTMFLGTMVLSGEPEIALSVRSTLVEDCICAGMWRVLALVMRGERDAAAVEAASLRRRIVDRWVVPGAPSDADIARWIASALRPGSGPLPEPIRSALSVLDGRLRGRAAGRTGAADPAVSGPVADRRRIRRVSDAASASGKIS